MLAVFSNAGRLLEAVQLGCAAGFPRMETFSPVRIERLDELMRQPKSPVRLFTLAGAIAGLIGGFALAIGTAKVNSLVVGGKPVVSPIPFCVIGFEGTILLGSLANLAGLVIYGRLFKTATSEHYDRRFSRDKFGLLIACLPEQVETVQALLAPAAPEEIHVCR